MMSKNSIVPFLKDYLIKFLTRPFLLDTNDIKRMIIKIATCFKTVNNFAVLNIIRKGHATGKSKKSL